MLILRFMAETIELNFARELNFRIIEGSKYHILLLEL